MQFFALVVLTIGIKITPKVKNVNQRNYLYFSIIFINAFFEMLYFVLPKLSFLRITTTSMYRLSFLLLICLNLYKREQRWHLFISILVLATLVFSYLIGAPLAFISSELSISIFSILAIYFLYSISKNYQKINHTSISEFLLFCLFMHEILFELLKENYAVASVSNIHLFQVTFATLVLINRINFIALYGKRIYF
jgi:hypothetical protein